MYLPVDNLKLWNLVASPDEQYFSQPTTHWMAGDGGPMLYHGTACAARCHIPMWASMGDGSTRTYTIQCGQLAQIAPDGAYLCAYHWHSLWECSYCGVVLTTDTEPYCSPACERAYAEAEAAARELEEDG